MDVFLSILAALFAVVGLLGCIVPMLPGPPMSYAAMILVACCSYSDLGWTTMVVFFIITVAVTVLDFLLPAWMARRFGGSRAGEIGATVGMIAGFFVFPPVGILLGPFVGAVVGELVVNREDTSRAMRVGFGAFMSFIVGTGLKLIASLVMLVYVFKEIASVFHPDTLFVAEHKEPGSCRMRCAVSLFSYCAYPVKEFFRGKGGPDMIRLL